MISHKIQILDIYQHAKSKGSVPLWDDLILKLNAIRGMLNSLPEIKITPDSENISDLL